MEIDLNDPSMKEIVDEFCDESLELCKEMVNILEDFEDNPKESSLLEVYGQMVDRIMGAALTLGLDRIGTICKLCKSIGYKASQSADLKLNGVVVNILLDAVDLIEELLTALKTNKEKKEVNFEAFISRLNWISDKFKHITRASVAAGNSEESSKDDAEVDFDDLIAQLS